MRKRWHIGSKKLLLLTIGISFILAALYSSSVGQFIGEALQPVSNTASLAMETQFSDGFEDGALSPFISPTTAKWSIAFGGLNGAVARSGSIGDGQATKMSLSVIVQNQGTVSFARRISSEKSALPQFGSTGDYLRFYVDGIKVDEWSGEVAWSTVSYVLTPGPHVLEWSYEKDASRSEGADAAWVDNVEIKFASVDQAVESSPCKPIYYPYYNYYNIQCFFLSTGTSVPVQFLEDGFEDGTLQPFEDPYGLPFSVTSEDKNSGVYSAIGVGHSHMALQSALSTPHYVTFYFKLDGGTFSFYRDDWENGRWVQNLLGSWSGTTGWQSVTYIFGEVGVTHNTQRLVWSHSGQGKAYVDDIRIRPTPLP